jgi:ATP-dependent Clp protease adaptor protein ClpS
VATKTVLEPTIGEGTSTKKEKLYHVIILNDEEHTIDYVVEMLQAVVRLSAPAALACTMEADSSGSSIVYTCGLEEAENKRDLIHAYGPDWRMPHSRGSVAALVEPAAE